MLPGRGTNDCLAVPTGARMKHTIPSDNDYVIGRRKYQDNEDVRSAWVIQRRVSEHHSSLLDAGETLTDGVPQERGSSPKGKQPVEDGVCFPPAMASLRSSHYQTPVSYPQHTTSVVPLPPSVPPLCTPVHISQHRRQQTNPYLGHDSVSNGPRWDWDGRGNILPSPVHTDIHGYVYGQRNRNASASATCRARYVSPPVADGKRPQSGIENVNKLSGCEGQLKFLRPSKDRVDEHSNQARPGSLRAVKTASPPVRGQTSGQEHGSNGRETSCLMQTGDNIDLSPELYKTDMIALPMSTTPLPVRIPTAHREKLPRPIGNDMYAHTLSHGRESIDRTALALGSEQEAATDLANEVERELYTIGRADEEVWNEYLDLESSLGEEHRVDPQQKVPWRPPHIPKSKFKPYSKCIRCGVHGHFKRNCEEFWRLSGSATRVNPFQRGSEDPLSDETGSKSSSNACLICEECGVSPRFWDCEYTFGQPDYTFGKKDLKTLGGRKPEAIMQRWGQGVVVDASPAEDAHRLFMHHPCEVCFPTDTSPFLTLRGFRKLGHLFLHFEKCRILSKPRDLREDERLRVLLTKLKLSHLICLLDASHFTRAAEELRNYLTRELQLMADLLEWECPHEHEEVKWEGYEERLAMREELLLEAHKWELVRWVSARVNSGGLKQAEKELLMNLLERLECRKEGELVEVVSGIVVPVPLVQGGIGRKETARDTKAEPGREGVEPGMSWNCFV
ncbi:hypothetical protein EV426DRAFT_707362 [Tirmania nivea]|nr:hypothetical protein EV426DRAFT_707362 [Tirmania nivea]